MKKLKYLLFIFICSLFMVNGVSAESEYYEFVKSEFYGEFDDSIGIKDALELDSGFLILSSRENAILVYDEDGNKTNTIALDFEPEFFVKIDDKSYIASFYPKIIFAELNDDLTIGDKKEFDSSLWLVNDRPLWETDEYIYLFGYNESYDRLILKLKKDLTSVEELKPESFNDEEKTYFSDYLNLIEKYNVLCLYDGGVIYSDYVLDEEAGDGSYNHVIYYYKDGEVKWSFVMNSGFYSVTEDNDNLILLSQFMTDEKREDGSTVVKTYIYTISSSGKLLESYDISEYFDALNGPIIPYASISSYYELSMTDNFVIISGTVVTSQKNNTGYDMMMYFKRKSKEVKDEKVPETSDSVYSYMIMLAISGLALTTLNYKKRYN